MFGACIVPGWLDFDVVLLGFIACVLRLLLCVADLCLLGVVIDM